MAGGGDITEFTTFWVCVAIILIGWPVAIVLKRINARRRAREKRPDPLDCFFVVEPEQARDAPDDLPLRFRKWDGQ